MYKILILSLNDEIEEEKYLTLGRDLGIFFIKKESSFQPVRKQTGSVRCGEWTIVKTISLLFHLCNI